MSPRGFATAVLRGLGKPVTPANVSAIQGWIRAEGGHWHNDARYNPLNTTKPAPGAGNTGSQGNIKVYRDWQQGVNATVQTLRNGRYGGILSALDHGNDPHAVAKAIGASPWGTNAALISKVLGAGPVNVGAAVSRGRASRAPGRSTTVTPPKTDFDSAAIDALMTHKSGSLLHAISNRLDSGAYTTPGTVTHPINHSPKGDTSGDALSQAVKDAGHVSIAATANRAGVKIQPIVLDFLHGLTRWAGNVNVGTGTNHNQYVLGTHNESEHWTGHAADIPATGKRGDQVAYAAFRQAGVSEAKARLYARNGGVYNFTHNGQHIQILWKTMVGGNHYNHVHIGVH